MTPQREDRIVWLAVTAFLLVLALLVFSLGRAHAQATQCIANVSAQGTPDAITSSALPCGTTTNLVLLSTSGANVTTTPTYQPIGSPALPILRADGTAVLAGDLQASYVALLSSTGTSWVLLNPYNNRSSSITIGATGVTGGSDGCLLERSGILLGCLVPGNGVATALGVNVGSPGAFVVNGGALGIPSGGTATNLVGLPILTGVAGLGGGVATALGLLPNTLGGIATWPVGGGVTNVINITNPPYNADPTGVSDSTAGINSAMTAAGTQCVYAPKGTYKVTDAVNLNKSGCFFGDGPTTSVLHADSTSFNLAALGVLVIPTNAGGNGPTVHDIGVSFTQPDTAVRASIVAFPPGIYAQAVSRQIYTNVQVGGGSYCLDARGNSTLQLVTFNCGSLVKGLQMDGGRDGSHVTGWHEWDFGFAGGGTPGLLTVYADQTNICMEIGRVDGITILSTQCYLTQIHWTANSTSSTDAHLLDSSMMDGGSLLIDNTPSTGLIITGIQFTATNATPATYQSLVVHAGSTKIVNCRIGSASAAPLNMIQVTGGNLSLNNCILPSGGTGVQLATVATGVLEISNSQTSGPAGATVPVFEQLSGSLIFRNNRFSAAPSGGTGIAVAFDADSIQNYLGPNVYNGWGYTIPASTALGAYGQTLSVTPPIGKATVTVTSADNAALVRITASDGTDPATSYYVAGGEQWSAGVNGSATYNIGEPGGTDLSIAPGGIFNFGAATGSRHKFTGRIGFAAATPPTVVCGGSPTIDAHATFMSGRVACGSGVVTTGTITFDAGDKPATWDHCTVFPHSDPGAFTYTYTTNDITINGTSLTNVVFNYQCDGS